jgi:PadR family transcriptional regulator, regulatory protein PadR
MRCSYIVKNHMSGGKSPPLRNCQCKKGKLRGFLQPRLLLCLAQEPTHGYELMDALSSFPDFSIDPGGLYRSLRSLEEDGLVVSAWDTRGGGAARRVYRLTNHGVDHLHAWAVDIRRTRQQLDEFLAEYLTLFPDERS